MKINVAAIYWIILFSLILILFLFVLVSHFIYQVDPGSPLVKNFYDQPIGQLQFALYMASLFWLLFLIVINYLLIKRNQFAWIVSLILSILNALVTIPSVFQGEVWKVFFEGMPWFINIFYGFTLLMVFMNIFILYALIVERKLFFTRG